MPLPIFAAAIAGTWISIIRFINQSRQVKLPRAWPCPDCTNLNYPDRTVCDMCGFNKAYERQLGFGDVGAAAAPAPPRQHSALQQETNLQAGMPSLIYPSSSGAPLSTLNGSQFATGHRGGPEEIPGAWSCPDCTYLNYPDRAVCDMCGLNKAYDGQLGFSNVGELQSRGSSPTRGVTVPDAFGDVKVDTAY